MAERMYPVRAVAELLAVSRDTVYRLIEERRLRAVHLKTPGRQLRVPESALDEYQQSLTAA